MNPPIIPMLVAIAGLLIAVITLTLRTERLEGQVRDLHRDVDALQRFARVVNQFGFSGGDDE